MRISPWLTSNGKPHHTINEKLYSRFLTFLLIALYDVENYSKHMF